MSRFNDFGSSGLKRNRCAELEAGIPLKLVYIYIYRFLGWIYVYHAETIVYHAQTVSGFIGSGPTLLDGSGRKWKYGGRLRCPWMLKWSTWFLKCNEGWNATAKLKHVRSWGVFSLKTGENRHVRVSVLLTVAFVTLVGKSWFHLLWPEQSRSWGRVQGKEYLADTRKVVLCTATAAWFFSIKSCCMQIWAMQRWLGWNLASVVKLEAI